MGWQEVEGIHSRTDYDLARHQEFSGKKMEYFEQESRERFIPYVVETSAGLDRTILMLLSGAYTEAAVGGDTRTALRLRPATAPIPAGGFPPARTDGLPDTARERPRPPRAGCT